MKEQLISLLIKLSSILEWKEDSKTKVDKQNFILPSFRESKTHFPKIYVLDELNNQITSHLKSLWYTTPGRVLDLPKAAGADLVLDTKSLYELNKIGDYKSFVDNLYIKLSELNIEAIGIKQIGIFINITVNNNYYLNHINQLQSHLNSYWTIHYPKFSGHKLLMEYSSPNMAKSMTIGHFRNTIIGQIMYNIIQQTWCPHFNRNYIGDRGTAFGKFVTILRYTYQNTPSIIDDIVDKPQTHMGTLYASYKPCERDWKDAMARNIVQLMEAGNETILELWKIIRQLSLIDFNTVYDILDVQFDCELGESFSVKLDNDVRSDLKDKDILHESQWALIIKMKRVDGSRKPLTSSELHTREEWVDQVIVYSKSDGSTLYAPRDLALLKYRTQVLWADNLIYVVGSEQSVYFEHLICLWEYLWWLKPWSMMHLGYGLYLQNGKKMSSRSGGVLSAYELINDISQAILSASEWRIDHTTAEKLAVSALIINDTKWDISKDVNLDITAMTKLNGDTWLYIQYTAVRTRSLLEKLHVGSDSDGSLIDKENLIPTDLKSLLFQTSLLPYKIRLSLDLMKPHILTQYLLDLAGRLNKWYNDSDKVLDMDNNQKNSVAIVLSTFLVVFEKVMALLHMPRVEKM